MINTPQSDELCFYKYDLKRYPDHENGEGIMFIERAKSENKYVYTDKFKYENVLHFSLKKLENIVKT